MLINSLMRILFLFLKLNGITSFTTQHDFSTTQPKATFQKRIK
jgi:hypothetical protein